MVELGGQIVSNLRSRRSRVDSTFRPRRPSSAVVTAYVAKPFYLTSSTSKLPAHTQSSSTTKCVNATTIDVNTVHVTLCSSSNIGMCASLPLHEGPLTTLMLAAAATIIEMCTKPLSIAFI